MNLFALFLLILFQTTYVTFGKILTEKSAGNSRGSKEKFTSENEKPKQVVHHIHYHVNGGKYHGLTGAFSDSKTLGETGVMKHMFVHVNRIKDHVKGFWEARQNIRDLFASLTQIRTVISQLIKRYNVENKSVLTMKKFLQKAYGKLSQNEESIKKAEKSQKHLTKTVSKMKNTYKKLSLYSKRVNSSSAVLRTKLQKLRKFEQYLKGDLNEMQNNTDKISFDVEKIKAKIHSKSDVAALQKIKNNQIMLVKTIVGISKKGKAFEDSMNRFGKRIAKVWAVLRYRHRRRGFLTTKINAVTRLIHKIKENHPVMNKGNSTLSNSLNKQYRELAKRQDDATRRLKTLKNHIKQTEQNADTQIEEFTDKQKLIFQTLHHIARGKKGDKSRMYKLNKGVKSLWKAVKKSGTKLYKVNTKMNEEIKAGHTKIYQRAQTRVIKVLNKKYRKMTSKVNRLLRQIRKMKIKHKHVMRLKTSYKKLQHDVQRLKKKYKRHKNVAFRRRTGQSTSYKRRYIASKAVDGRLKTFTHTKRQRYPYWWVDLGRTYIIKGVKIANRQDSHGRRLRNLVVKVDRKVCTSYRGPAKTRQMLRLKCRKSVKGRKVTIMIKGRGILSLAEVKVIAIRVKPGKPVKWKVKPRKPVKWKGKRHSLMK